MAVRTAIDNPEGIYFITFTCHHWLPLFEITKGYDTVYKWFDYLKSKGHNVKGYVITPLTIRVTPKFSKLHIKDKSDFEIFANAMHLIF